VALVLSLLAATAYGLGTVLQQKGTLQDDLGGTGVHFVAGLFRRKVWLVGGAVTAAGAVCQTLALRTGPLAAVQAVTTLSLVIALPFGVWLTDQRLTPRVWAGACATAAGVVLFVAVGSPQNGTAAPSGTAWWWAGLSTAVLAGVLVRAAALRSGSTQALLFGTAAGLGFGMATALAKVGLTVFGESFARGPGHLAAVVTGLAVALAGIVLLSHAPAPAARAPAPMAGC
jgi:drug/metabolite transporter (DMT)-like permease